MPHVVICQPVKAKCGQDVYRLLKDMERYPSFMQDLVSVTVRERTADTTVTAWKSNVNGMSIEWVELDVFDDAAMRIQYTQIEGDLQIFSGAWQVEARAEEILVTLTAEFELGIPMVAGLVHPLLKMKIRQNCLEMLAAIERELHK